jgi:hypothetical protein
MTLRKKLIALSIAALTVPVIAQAPQAMSIIVNGVAMQGKALNYKGRLYVPLEDLATATGGKYTLDAQTGTVVATVLTPNNAGRPGEILRPFLKVTYERKYTSQSNARVLATIVNQGDRLAKNVEVFCVFKSGATRELNTAVQNLGDLGPGERRTLEFRLYDSGSVPTNQEPVVSVGRAPDDHVLVNGEWVRVSYELKFQYQ